MIVDKSSVIYLLYLLYILHENLAVTSRDKMHPYLSYSVATVHAKHVKRLPTVSLFFALSIQPVPGNVGNRPL
jgi:hypothetical protein